MNKKQAEFVEKERQRAIEYTRGCFDAVKEKFGKAVYYRFEKIYEKMNKILEEEMNKGFVTECHLVISLLADLAGQAKETYNKVKELEDDH